MQIKQVENGIELVDGDNYFIIDFDDSLFFDVLDEYLQTRQLIVKTHDTRGGRRTLVFVPVSQDGNYVLLADAYFSASVKTFFSIMVPLRKLESIAQREF